MPTYSNIKQCNFYIHPSLGASGNTGKGFYKVTVTSGGTSTPTNYTHYIKGMTSNATAIVCNTTNTSGTWGAGTWAGYIHITQATGTFTNGETLGLYLVADDTQVSADVATYTASTYAVDSFALIDHATAAKGLATTAPIVGIAKSTAPTSTGVTASVTKGSRTVTLSGSVTTLITDCEATTGFTAYNSASVATSTTRKLGSNSIQLTLPASPATSTKYLVFDIGASTDYSAKQQLNFWFMPSTSADGTKYVVKLCSDAAGDTPLHTFTLDKVTTNAQWIPYVFDNGSALANNVRSVAIYSGASAPSANSVIKIDNIFLSTAPSSADSLTLKSLISFSSADNVQGNIWYPIKSINGTDVQIDQDPNSAYNQGRGWSDDTVTTQTLYKREAFTVFTNTSNTTALQTTQVSGDNSTYIEYQGGINPQTLVQEGYTFYTGDNGWGAGVFVNKSFVSINRLGFIRYYYGYSADANSTNPRLQDISLIGCYNGGSFTAANPQLLDGYLNANLCRGNTFYYNGGLFATNNSIIRIYGSGISATNFAFRTNNDYCTNKLNNVYIYNGGDYGISANGTWYINKLYTRDNSSGAIGAYTAGTCNVYINYTNIAEATDVNISANNEAMFQDMYDINLGQVGGTANNDQKPYYQGRAYKQASEKPSDVSYAWKLSPTANAYRSKTPIKLRISPKHGFFVEASKQVTIKARIKVSNANITGGILVPALQAGLTADQIVTSVSTNASWGEEVTLQFTPTEAGGIEVYFIAYYPDNSSVHTYSAYLAAPNAVGGVYTMFTQAT